MSFFILFLALLNLYISASIVEAKAVFAHIVVGNTASHTVDLWTTDISLAKSFGIDAFVLNIAYPDGNIPIQVANAFAAAEAADYKLWFAFDYLGGGQPWPATGDLSVAGYLNKYKDSSAYYKVDGAPLASTFEGINNIGDWAPGGIIRSAVGSIFFVPDWTSLGPGNIGASLANIEGFFSWDMWPDGPQNSTTEKDKKWIAAIDGKAYMMGVSPWFFHSSPKAWVWRGDDLWADRWAQTLELQPEFVQIVTWNDFGEASYVGPVHSMDEVPSASKAYIPGVGNDHVGWASFLPYYIARYKGVQYTIDSDHMQYWYRRAPAASGSTCGVTGNSADQQQQEYSPAEILQDGVFFSALLTGDATVQVKIGASAAVSFSGSAGINHWSLPFGGREGTVTFSVVRNGAVVKNGEGPSIGGIGSAINADGGCANYNAWVGSF
ncbi:putative glucan endo-1,3-alpha-glucosidase agn1 [Bisporella sp. PMI_857]|nr:putative glucan endo-1,3-alpha-glucosidase agn1 [Bisporella sp. PMI_857]